MKAKKQTFKVYLSDLGIDLLNTGQSCSAHRTGVGHNDVGGKRHPYTLVPGHTPSGESSKASAQRASRVLRDKRTGILARALAGSVLSQAANKAKKKGGKRGK